MKTEETITILVWKAGKSPTEPSHVGAWADLWSFVWYALNNLEKQLYWKLQFLIDWTHLQKVKSASLQFTE